MIQVSNTDKCRNQNIDVDSFIKEISNITVPMIDTISFSQMQEIDELIDK